MQVVIDESSCPMILTDHLLVPYSRTTDSNEVIMSISSMKKCIYIASEEHLHSTHTQSELSCSRCLSQYLKTVQMSASCFFIERKKHKADCRVHKDHLETIIVRKSILRPFILSLDSSPCPSVPISSLKVVYSSCLFFGIISVKIGG